MASGDLTVTARLDTVRRTRAERGASANELAVLDEAHRELMSRPPLEYHRVREDLLEKTLIEVREAREEVARLQAEREAVEALCVRWWELLIAACDPEVEATIDPVEFGRARAFGRCAKEIGLIFYPGSGAVMAHHPVNAETTRQAVEQGRLALTPENFQRLARLAFSDLGATGAGGGEG